MSRGSQKYYYLTLTLHFVLHYPWQVISKDGAFIQDFKIVQDLPLFCHQNFSDDGKRNHMSSFTIIDIKSMLMPSEIAACHFFRNLQVSTLNYYQQQNDAIFYIISP